MSIGPDILLDPDTHDWQIVDGDLVIGEDVAQAQKIHLLTRRGEWFQDRSIGVAYDVVFGKPFDRLIATQELTRAIVGSPGTLRVTQFNLTFDPATRSARVDYESETIEGTIGASAEVAE